MAFALDALWANYQEAKVERRVLTEAVKEFESAKTRIESSIAELEVVIGASSGLVNSLGKDAMVLSPSAAQDLVSRMLAINTLEVPTSVVDSIIASGQVRLVSSSELRETLAEWPTFVSDVRKNHESHRVETDEYLIPYLAKYVSLRDVLITSGDASVEPGTFDYDVLPMQRDRVFEGRLTNRISRQLATLRESKILLNETEKLFTLTAGVIS